MAGRPAEWWTDWLGRQDGYSRQSYEHLGATLARLGHPDTGKDVLYEGRNREAATRRFPASIFMWLSRVFIGYGYRPYRALYWAVGLVVLGALMLRMSGRGPSNKMPYGLAFSFDTLLPLITLRELHYEIDLKGWVRYYFYFHKLMGYLLASYIVAGCQDC